MSFFSEHQKTANAFAFSSAIAFTITRALLDGDKIATESAVELVQKIDEVTFYTTLFGTVWVVFALLWPQVRARLPG